jgi:5-carboxymethyl-2-hydroxymuconate isomerase
VPLPHVIVEYSANLERDVSPGGLVDSLHAAALATE